MESVKRWAIRDKKTGEWYHQNTGLFVDIFEAATIFNYEDDAYFNTEIAARQRPHATIQVVELELELRVK